MKACVKLKKYPDGGYVGDYRGNFWEKTRDTLGNYAKAGADIGLSGIGLSNVIGDEAYKGYNADPFRKYAKIGGTINQIAGAAALGYAGVNPQLLQAGQQTISQFNPQEQYTYPYGGKVGAPNAELELQENTLNPDGSTTQINAPSHAQGGLKMNLDPNTLVFSDRLKDPLTKKTYADLHKKYLTKKEEKILNDKNSNSLAKKTAQVNLAVKNTGSLKLYEQQEQLKIDKLNKYASKRLGIEGFKWGGKYPDGGIYGPFIRPDLPIMQNFLAAQNANTANAMKGMTPTFGDQTNQPLNLNSNLANQGATIQTNGVAPGNNYPENWAINTNQTNNAYSTPDAKTSNINWTDVGVQALAAAPKIAADIYDIKRSKNADIQRYDRVKTNLTDPTEALRYNDMAFRSGAEALKNASGGNASTYIQNRKDLDINRMMSNARIRQDSQNINASILNNAEAFNANIQRAESDANLANLGRTRDIRANAYKNMAQTGSDVLLSGRRDYNTMQRDEQYIAYLKQTYPNLFKK